MIITPVILAGGVGERLWPLSQADMPKQFILRDAAGHSLFQAALLRVADRNRFHAPLVVCSHQHRFVVREQLESIGIRDGQIILEPEGRNTGPAIALAAIHIREQHANGLMLVLPSDHRVDRPAMLRRALVDAAPMAKAGHIVTFAVTPTTPETGYGYIHYGAPLGNSGRVRAIARFVEKPDAVTAAQLLASGDYGWNSGIFLLDVQVAVEQYQRHAPAMLRTCREAYDAHAAMHGYIALDAASFAKIPPLAFDYAVMEATDRGAVIVVDMGWHDLGSWQALAGLAATDDAANAVTGRATSHDVEGSVLYAQSMHIAAMGLRDMMVVESNGHVLVAPKNRMGELKMLVGKVVSEHGADDHGRQTHRPWGHFTCMDRGAGYQVKKLAIRPGEKISLQVHRLRAEHWVVVNGVATVTRDDTEFELTANQSVYIAQGQRHRLENRGHEVLVVIEVQTGDYLGEDDIERFEDAYQRTDA